jgi:dimeric dUTPase (all-alpha-NTP-PPase superfamily)
LRLALLTVGKIAPKTEKVNEISVDIVEKNFEALSVDSSNSGQDMLAHIFELQEKLGKRIGVDPTNFTEKERTEWVLNYARAMQQEIAELIDSLPWKWWANYQRLDLQNARVEVVDVLHFLVATALTLGMGPNDLYEVFCKKNAMNHARQDRGYGQRDGDDARHI